jgi:hypothetical protein
MVPKQAKPHSQGAYGGGQSHAEIDHKTGPHEAGLATSIIRRLLGSPEGKIAAALVDEIKLPAEHFVSKLLMLADSAQSAVIPLLTISSAEADTVPISVAPAGEIQPLVKRNDLFESSKSHTNFPAAFSAATFPLSVAPIAAKMAMAKANTHGSLSDASDVMLEHERKQKQNYNFITHDQKDRVLENFFNRQARLPPSGYTGFDPWLSPAWPGRKLPN